MKNFLFYLLMLLISIITWRGVKAQGKQTAQVYQDTPTIRNVPIDLMITGGQSFSAPAAMRTPDGKWTITNDTLALETVYNIYMDLLEKYRAATKVLDYMNTDGTITNWKKWTAAVKEYIRLTQGGAK